MRAAKALPDTGALGEPVLATIEMRGIRHWMSRQAELGCVTLRSMSIHHLDCFRYWFGDPEGIYCSVRPDPRTKFPHTDGICTYIVEYRNGLRCVGIDDTWTGLAKEGCPGDIYIRWRIEGLNGLAIGDIGWCEDPHTTRSTIRWAAKGDTAFHEPRWTESWCPDAFVGTMAQVLMAPETGTEPAISGRDKLEGDGAGGGGVFECGAVPVHRRGQDRARSNSRSTSSGKGPRRVFEPVLCSVIRIHG